MRACRGLLVLLFAALTPGPRPLAAQDRADTALADSLRVAIEAAAERGDVAALDASAAVAERALGVHPADALLRHYSAYADYRAGTIVLGRGTPAAARAYFDRARDALESLTQQRTIPESYALLSAVYGMQIATSRVPALAGMRLGPKSDEAMSRALAAGPRNPRVWLVRGIGAFNTPAAFGGGRDRAEGYLRQALALFIDDAPAPPLPDWGRADAHIWLGRVHAARSSPDSARAHYRAALALQPRNAWASTLLSSLD